MYTGDIPSTKEASALQILSSMPLPRPYLSLTISIISQKIAITFIF